jgi:hypothetical protein
MRFQLKIHDMLSICAGCDRAAVMTLLVKFDHETFRTNRYVWPPPSLLAT